MATKFGMAEAKVLPAPFKPGSTFGMGEVHEQEGVDPGMAHVPYKSLVGSLMYLAVCTRLTWRWLRRCYDAIREDIIALGQAYTLEHITGMKEGRMVI